MTAVEVLESGGWTQGCAGRNAAGAIVWVDDTPTCEAVSFCVLGAIWRAYGFNTRAANAFEERVRAVLSGVEPTWWNDTPGRTKEEVVELLRKAGV